MKINVRVFKYRRVCKHWYQAGNSLPRPIFSYTALSSPIFIQEPRSTVNCLGPYFFDLVSQRWIAADSVNEFKTRVHIISNNGTLLHTLDCDHKHSITRDFRITPVLDGNALEISDRGSGAFYVCDFRKDTPRFFFCDSLLSRVSSMFLLSSELHPIEFLPFPVQSQDTHIHVYKRSLVIQTLTRTTVYLLAPDNTFKAVYSNFLSGYGTCHAHRQYVPMQFCPLDISLDLEGEQITKQVFILNLDTMQVRFWRLLRNAVGVSLAASADCGVLLLGTFEPNTEKINPPNHIIHNNTNAQIDKDKEQKPLTLQVIRMRTGEFLPMQYSLTIPCTYQTDNIANMHAHGNMLYLHLSSGTHVLLTGVTEQTSDTSTILSQQRKEEFFQFGSMSRAIKQQPVFKPHKKDNGCKLS